MKFSLVEMLYNNFACIASVKPNITCLEKSSFEDTENSVPCKARTESTWPESTVCS